MTDIRSKSHIIRATGIIGGASVINMAMGLVRTKITAIVLGASGIGLIGILLSLMSTAATVATWGISNTGARAIAAATDEEDLATARSSFFWGAIFLALSGTAIAFIVRNPLSRWLFEDTGHAWMIGWVAIGVGLMVLTVAQNGFLTGFKRVGDLARVSAGSAVLTTLLTVPLVLLFGRRAILPYVILAPLVTLAVGTHFVRKLPRTGVRPSVQAVVTHWPSMIGLGAALTVGGVVTIGGQLAMRVIVQRDLGLDGVGIFQASFTISVNYIALALGALSTDYYPRLVPHVGDPKALRRLINDQALVSLLLAAPLIVAVIGFAPLVVVILYAPSFQPASEMLRWQLLGDVFKLVNWPVGYVLIASGRGRAFALNEIVATTTGLGLMWILVPRIGIGGAGVAYLAQQSVYAVSLNLLVRKQTGSIWEGQTVRCWLLVAGAALVSAVMARVGPFAGMAVSSVAAMAIGVLSFRHLHHAFPQRLRGKLPLSLLNHLDR